jgi:DNA-binding response OmpR family regulator
VLGCGAETIDYLSGKGRFADRHEFPLPTHVLLDLKLPKVSGVEILRWIRGIPHLATLPVAILSAPGEKKDLSVK